MLSNIAIHSAAADGRCLQIDKVCTDPRARAHALYIQNRKALPAAPIATHLYHIVALSMLDAEDRYGSEDRYWRCGYIRTSLVSY